jgi:hypothetical protein
MPQSARGWKTIWRDALRDDCLTFKPPVLPREKTRCAPAAMVA